MLKPMVIEQVEKKQALQKQYQDRGSKRREFDIVQSVLAKNVHGVPKWLPGVVLEKVGAVSYRVQVGGVWRRHADQIMNKSGEMEMGGMVSQEVSIQSSGDFVPISPDLPQPETESPEQVIRDGYPQTISEVVTSSPFCWSCKANTLPYRLLDYGHNDKLGRMNIGGLHVTACSH